MRFSAPILVSSFQQGTSDDVIPIDKNSIWVEKIKQLPSVERVGYFSEKTGLVKTDEQNFGVILKGVSSPEDLFFLKQYLTSGELPSMQDSTASNEVLISEYVAHKLQLHLSDKVRMYFIGTNGFRARAFTVTGIYESGIPAFDQQYIIGDIRHIQNLNGWQNHQAGGMEIFLKEKHEINQTITPINNLIPFDLQALSIYDRYPDIFGWLALTDMNVIVILIIMAVVSTITMVSGFMIQILEKTSMIGLLKSLGSNNKSIKNIFIRHATYITIIGVLLGNILGISLCLLQKYLHLFKLDQSAYFLNTVPIELHWFLFLLINITTILLCMVAMLIPAGMISKISPIKALKFE